MGSINFGGFYSEIKLELDSVLWQASHRV